MHSQAEPGNERKCPYTPGSRPYGATGGRPKGSHDIPRKKDLFIQKSR